MVPVVGRLLTSDVSQPAGMSSARRECVLDIAHEVRAHVGVTIANKCLSRHQYATAMRFLRHDVFEKKYMRNQLLRAEIQAYESYPDSFNLQAEQELRESRDPAYNAWVHDLMGDTALFLAVVKHGLYDTKEHDDFKFLYHQLWLG